MAIGNGDASLEARFAAHLRDHGDRDERLFHELSELHGAVERLERVTHADLASVHHEVKRHADALTLLQGQARAPLPSMGDDDLEQIETTLNGSPVYKVSDPQLRAIRETDMRHARQEFAVGEDERIQLAVMRALTAHQTAQDDAAKARQAARDAAPVIWIRSEGVPLVAKWAAGGLLGLLWTAIVIAVHSLLAAKK